SLFEPGVIASKLPARCSSRRAIIFSVFNCVVAAVIFISISGLTARRLIFPSLRLAALAVIATWACQSIMAAWLNIVLVPTDAPRSYRFCGDLTHYLSAGMTLSALAVGYFWLRPPVPANAVGMIVFCGYLIFAPTLVLMPVWWMVALSATVNSRSVHARRQVVALLGTIGVL